MWSNFPLFPKQASTIAGRVDLLFFFAIAVAVFFTLLVFALVIGLAIKYRRRSADDVPDPIEGSTKLEIMWSIIPLGIALTMFTWGASLYFTMYRPPTDALEINVIGKQWMWKLQHPTGQREINELHIPIGQPIRLTMASEDVIHSFYVPAFRIKRDVLPGQYSTTWFEATEVGEYHLFCAEYCGAEHSLMIGKVIVMEPPDYQKWLSGDNAHTAASLTSAGENRFEQLGCKSCHHSNSGARGPNLAGLFGNAVGLQTGETVLADAEYIRESILRPNAKLVVGYKPLMPTYQGQITESGLMEIIAYLKTLGGEEVK